MRSPILVSCWRGRMTRIVYFPLLPLADSLSCALPPVRTTCSHWDTRWTCVISQNFVVMFAYEKWLRWADLWKRRLPRGSWQGLTGNKTNITTVPVKMLMKLINIRKELVQRDWAIVMQETVQRTGGSPWPWRWWPCVSAGQLRGTVLHRLLETL